MPKVAIISKPQKPELEFILTELLDWLTRHGLTPILEPDSAAYIGLADASIARCDLAAHEPVLVICLGGDGTLL